MTSLFGRRVLLRPLSLSDFSVWQEVRRRNADWLTKWEAQRIPGQPDVTVSNRGYGTQAAVDPVIIGAHKTRLNDPVMSFLGTNNAPGDYRQSGCASCHVVYANDRSEYNSGTYAKYGNRGLSFSDDPTIPKDEPGHPIQHSFTRSIPSSQCITCHVHNGNGFLNTYLGYMWWDEETDGEFLYPKKQHNPTQAEIDKAGRFNPEEAAARGLWKDTKFLETVSDLNPQMKKMQVSDYHGHGWMFRRVYKQDRKGNYLTANGDKIDFNDPDLWKKAVHLQDIHLEKGMHCVDCHFNQDAHGNGKIYGDRRATIEISCEDCHGSITKKITRVADMKTSGFGAPDGGNKINERTPFGATRFVVRQGKLFQRSMVKEGQEWEVIQVQDSVTPGNEHYNEKSAAAKTILKDGTNWGSTTAAPDQLAHGSDKISCVACHSSWTTNCFGCHLAASVNTKKPLLHMEGDSDETQVYASYNPQVLRADGYMLGIDGSVQGHKVMPVRSSSVVSFSVRNNTRGWIVNHVPTISAAGYNGNAFNTHPPHTVRAKETKQCTDCHVSANNDNNAWLAGITMQGTNQVNFMGKYIYMAQGKGGVSATRVTEDDQPEAVFGSHLQQIAYPDNYQGHLGRKGLLTESHSNSSYDVQQVQMYSEYALAAAGKKGFVVFDIANVANKDFSQRITTAPFSPLGQGLYVRTANATGVAVGSPIPLDPLRVQLPENEEIPVAPLFGFAFISDSVEGLVTVDIKTLEDGIPYNNFLKKAASYNPGGKLTGARSIKVVGNYVFICTDHGLEIVNISDPANPRFVTEVAAPLRDPRNVAVQFRYAFVTDADGLKVLDITDIEHPQPVGGSVPLSDAHGLYLSRTYAYVAAGSQGLAIIDIEHPEQPKLDQIFNADGTLNDARDVKLGMVNVSLFAFVADGKNGLKVVELTNPETVPGNLGWSPRTAPRQVAYYPTKSPAIAMSEGYRRDRAVDESGNQISVFGRRGARPFNLEEMRRLYIRNGKIYTVTDEPPRKTASIFTKTSVTAAVSWFGLMIIILPLSFLMRSRRRD